MASSTILSATFFGSTRYFPVSTLALIPRTRLVLPAPFPLGIEPLRSSLLRALCAKVERPPILECHRPPALPFQEISSGGKRNFTETPDPHFAEGAMNVFRTRRRDDVIFR